MNDLPKPKGPIPSLWAMARTRTPKAAALLGPNTVGFVSQAGRYYRVEQWYLWACAGAVALTGLPSLVLGAVRRLCFQMLDLRPDTSDGGPVFAAMGVFNNFGWLFYIAISLAVTWPLHARFNRLRRLAGQFEDHDREQTAARPPTGEMPPIRFD